MAIDNILYVNTASIAVLSAADASGVLGVISASHALAADSVDTAVSAAYAAVANTALTATSSNTAISAAFADIANTALTATASNTATSASHALQADAAISASYAASYAEMPKYKSGVVAAAAFGGAPLTASVAFSTAFDDENYSVGLSSGASRNWTVESVTAAGFVISSNSGQSLGSDVLYWTAMAHGESN